LKSIDVLSPNYSNKLKKILQINFIRIKCCIIWKTERQWKSSTNH